MLEGIDGVGKDTQAERLVLAAEERGIVACKLAYPDYSTPVGRDITAYQRGDFGELESINPRLASYTYAVNRLETKPKLVEALKQHDLVVAARYAPSNVAFMSARVAKNERKDFQVWLEALDYTILGNTRPDHIVLLDLDPELAASLAAGRSLGRRDIHDENLEYQKKVREVYTALAEARSDWHVVDCSDNKLGGVRPIESIGDEISALVLDKLLSTTNLSV